MTASARTWKAGVAAVVLAILAGAGSVMFSTDPPPSPLRIAVAHRNASASVYVALDKGFFAEEGLAVELIEPATAAEGVAAMFTDGADITVAPQMPVILAALERRPLAILASVAHSENRVGLVLRPDVGGLKDLRGRKVGMTAGTNSELLLRMLLRDAGMAMTDIVVVDLPPGEMQEALAAGSVEAVSAFNPFLAETMAKVQGSRIVTGNGRFIDVWMMLSSQDFIDTNPERVQKALRAMLKATKHLHANPEESREIAAKHGAGIGGDWNHADFRLRLVDFLPRTLANDAELLVEQLEAVPDFPSLIYSAPLRTVAPEAVSLPQ